ncbi:MAG TPA: glycosyltransferase family 4 protein [Patescibacteria group bacterium]|nr:glycosyltransferase family 4 protein [Patescibacteria group bacterium]
MKKIIVHVASHYPPYMGGLEIVAKSSADLMAKMGYKVRVITTDKGIDKSAVLSKDNPQVTYMKSFEFAHTPFAPALLWNLLKLPKNSIIHLHLAQAYFPELVLIASKVRGIPYIAHFHLDVEQSGFFGPLFVIYKKIFWKRILGSAKKVIVCSSDQKLVVQKKFGVKANKIVVIPNGVSDSFFSGKKYKPSAKAARLLYVGRLTVQKRVERLIETVSLLNIPVNLKIIGDGEDRSKLEDLAKSLNLTNISFEGGKSPDQIKKHLKDSDIFLLSSDKEGGTPLVALEAMASKLPVIATNVSGVRDLLKNTGILVDKPYSKSFAREIEKLWKDKGRLIKLSDLSVKKAEGYRWSVFAQNLDKVYKDVSVGDNLS